MSDLIKRNRPWYEYSDWQEALDRYLELEKEGGGRLVFDLKRLSEAFYQPPIYDMADAILVAESDHDPDGRRYLSRVMRAVFIRLHDLAGEPS